MNRPRVLIADDHAMIVAGLAKLLEPDYELVGTAADGQALIERGRSLRPDVMVVDISMPVVNGIEAVRRLRAEGVESRVIFLTMHVDRELAHEALGLGISGFLLKQSAAEELLFALSEALAGRTYVTPLIVEQTAAFEQPKLTSREREVLRLIAEGKSAKEVAGLLGISTRTAEFHKYNLMDKLQLRSTAELTRYALKHGVI